MACNNDRCYNGWIRWNGSEYPCSACEKDAKEKRQATRQVCWECNGSCEDRNTGTNCSTCDGAGYTNGGE